MENGQPCIAELPAEARRLHPRLYLDSEKAQFGAAESRARAADEWDRSDHVHSWRWPQPAGALNRAHPRRPREGSSRRSLSRGARGARYRGCREPQTEPFEVRRQAAKGCYEVK